MKEILMSNIPAAVATIGLVLYFFGMAIVFIISPLKNAESFSVKPVDNAGITEIRVYYGGIKKMYEDGKLELEPPYPVGDKESKGGYIWSSFSKNRMLERIVFQYENGLFEYKKVVEAYFPNIMNTLSLYIALPTRIVGQLVFNENNDDYLDGQPRLTWYALPLNSDQHSIIDISYDNTVKIGDDVIRENIIHCLNHNRKDNKEFIWSSVISGFCFEATSTPITDWVYDKLYSDFKKIGWIDG